MICSESEARKSAAALGLTVEQDRSPLQEPVGGRRALLAALYPHAKRIVLFERNIDAYCKQTEKDPVTERPVLILHEIAHYRDWLDAQKANRKWRPRCPKAELRIRRLLRL